MTPNALERIAAMEAKCEERTKTFDELAKTVKELNGNVRKVVALNGKIQGAMTAVWLMTAVIVSTQHIWSKWFK